MLTKRKLFAICFFGINSGFTLMISGNTLNYWLAEEQIDIRTIGIFALISLPYAINFIWAPLLDSIHLGRLRLMIGHRLSWICLIQFLLFITILLISRINPKENLSYFAYLGFIISLLSSTQDTLLGALKTEIIVRESQGEVSGIYIFGYRIGMLISGSGAIYLSEYIAIGEIYFIFSLIVLIFPFILIFLVKYSLKYTEDKAPLHIEEKKVSDTFYNYKIWINIQKSLVNFFNIILKSLEYKQLILLVIFLILYRLPDNFINIMINPFLIYLGYSAKEIATTGKFFGMVTAIVGGLIASRVMRKKNIIDSLFLFGIFHALAHILFIFQEIYGKNLPLLFVVISIESITGGMTMAAYIAFIASLCHGKFRATQYSFFSSMMGFSRALFPAMSGYIVTDYGWRTFFAFTTIMAIPSLFLLFKIRPILKKMHNYYV